MPVLSGIADVTVEETDLVQISFDASDADLPAQDLDIRLEGNLPDGLNLDPDQKQISWQTDESDGGSEWTMKLVATEKSAPFASVEQSFKIVVKEKQHAPEIMDLADQVVRECGLLSLVVFASDSDLPVQPLTFSLGDGTPSWIVIDPETGQLTIQGTGGASTNEIQVIVTEAVEPFLSTTQSFSLVVEEIATNLFSLASGSSLPGVASQCSVGKVFYSFEVPEGATRALFELYGLTGAADLILKRGSAPTELDFDARGDQDGTVSERITLTTNQDMPSISGTWFAGVSTLSSTGLNYQVRATLPMEVAGGTILLSAEPLKVVTSKPDTQTETFEMDFGTVIGEKYVVEVSTNLFNWSVLTNIVVSGPNSKFVDPSPYTDNLLRFYRIQQVPQ